MAWHQDAPGRRDFVDLELHRSGGTVLTDNSDDVKKRILDAAVVPGLQFELRLRGRDIRGNDAVCGHQGKQVYFAFMYASDPGF